LVEVNARTIVQNASYTAGTDTAVHQFSHPSLGITSQNCVADMEPGHTFVRVPSRNCRAGTRAACLIEEGSLSPRTVVRFTPHLLRSILLFLLFSLFAGCGLFTTREPEPPTGSRSGGDLALTPQEVLIQLGDAFNLRDPNLYLGLIDEEFRYQALPSAYPEDPGYFSSWSRSREEIFIRTLLSVSLLPPDSLSELTFESVSEQEWPDSSIFRERYALQIHTVQESLPDRYSGLMTLTLARGEDGGWRIHRWLDEAVSGENLTMSQLRAAL